MLLGQCTSFFALHLYLAGQEESSGEEELWALLGGLEASFVIFFTVFTLSIERRFIATFFSTETAKQFRVKAFREASSDRMKINILKLHPSYYKSIRSELEQWVKENWDGWVEEQPQWFTERVKASVPKDMIASSEEKRGEK